MASPSAKMVLVWSPAIEGSLCAPRTEGQPGSGLKSHSRVKERSSAGPHETARNFHRSKTRRHFLDHSTGYAVFFLSRLENPDVYRLLGSLTQRPSLYSRAQRVLENLWRRQCYSYLRGNSQRRYF